MGLCVFSLPNSPVMIVIMCTLSYHHHQIGSMNHKPLFRVRSWNNGMRCMSYYVLLYKQFEYTKRKKGLMSQVGNILLYKLWSRMLVFSITATAHERYGVITNIRTVLSTINWKRGPLWGESTRHRSPKNASDVGLWCFLWSAPELTIETPVNEDAIALIVTIMTSL